MCSTYGLHIRVASSLQSITMFLHNQSNILDCLDKKGQNSTSRRLAAMKMSPQATVSLLNRTQRVVRKLQQQTMDSPCLFSAGQVPHTATGSPA